MTKEDQKAILEKYERIESLYRQYKYAKDMSDQFLLSYFKEIQALPSFCVSGQIKQTFSGVKVDEN